MNLKQARKVCAKMRKNLGGEYIDALDTLGAHLSYLSWQTRHDGYEAGGFGGPEFLKALHEAWPERDIPAPFDVAEFVAQTNQGRPRSHR